MATDATSPRALILLSLVDGPRHGYAIVEDIRQLSGVTLGPGTLYGALAALEEQGDIVALPFEGRRRPYELTPRGRDAAAHQADLWERLAAAAARKRTHSARAAVRGPVTT